MTKPWAISRGPILATDIDIKKAAVINALLVRPIGILPKQPGDEILPFAIGLFEEIRVLLKPDVSATTLCRAVGAYIHSKRYYLASAQPDSLRHNIEGAPAEALTTQDRTTAQDRFGALKQRTGGCEDKFTSSLPSPPAPALTMTRSEQIRSVLLGRSRLQRSPSSAS